jgi:hypothetical protein
MKFDWNCEHAVERLFGLEADVPEQSSNSIDLVIVLIDSLPGDFIAPAYEPVRGTKYDVVRLGLVPKLLDKEVLAALRAFNIGIDHAIGL